MSFSGEVKKELAHLAPVCDGCKKAMLYGIFLMNRVSKHNRTLMHTEHKAVADCYIDLLTGLTGCIVTMFISDYTGPKQRRSYTVGAEHQEDVDAIYRFFEIDLNGTKRTVKRAFLQNDCCLQAFVRGAFMACGSVTDPQKEYHLEFTVGDDGLAGELAALLAPYGVSLKHVMRKGSSVLYLKESEPIEDLLTFMGASNSSLELMNVKIYKDVRNKVNRITNCETANIGKTVNAAAEQLDGIYLIERTIGFGQLPDDLRELAELRLENPDMSLRELCMELSEPLSRSGVNHRLKRLAAIARGIREKQEAGARHV